jgi:hypothetical protein
MTVEFVSSVGSLVLLTVHSDFVLVDRTHVPNLHIIMRRADWDR